MALFRRKNEFKPDRFGRSLLSRLYIPKHRRERLLRWVLYGAVLVLLSLLQESGVEILTEHAIAGVTDGAVELKKTDTGEIVTRPADIVVMALGNRPDKSYEQQLKDTFDKVVFVGDAHKGGTMADATLSAYENCWFF